MAKKSIFCHKISNFAKNFGQFFVFFWCEFCQYKIDVADTGAEAIVASAKAQTWKILGAKMSDGGFKAIIATCATPLAETNLAKRQIKIIAD